MIMQSGGVNDIRRVFFIREVREPPSIYGQQQFTSWSNIMSIPPSVVDRRSNGEEMTWSGWAPDDFNGGKNDWWKSESGAKHLEEVVKRGRGYHNRDEGGLYDWYRLPEE